MKGDRYSELRRAMAESGLDAVALVPGSSFRRLFGRSFHSHERPLCVLIPASGTPAAALPHLEASAFATIDFEGDVILWRDEEGFQGAFDALGRARPGRARIGVEGQVMRVFEEFALARACPAAEIVDAGRAIAAIRLRKTAEEVARLREAIRISETAFAATLAEVRVGMTEKRISAILLRNLFEAGAEALSFHPIVAAGANSAQPHAVARPDYAIRPGDALLFDFGASRAGYLADITRTVFVDFASDEDRALYDTVLVANEAGRAAVRPGLAAGALDDTVLGVLEASPFRDCIRHKTGHGLGLDVHEEPYIMRGSQVALAPGMVFTIEPGLYREDRIGVRIEDDVVVTETGCEVLTSFPRELRIVG
ncbi:MAG TPA: Xaa-Pro peptidase family protein [Paracoccaceae bacterium]|nr:Xaa-Pro peptidase family protein [Paracoccaceae bacterium]